MAASSSGPKLVNVEVAPRNESFKRIGRNVIHSQPQEVRFSVQPAHDRQQQQQQQQLSSAKYVINSAEVTKPAPPQVYLKSSEIGFNLPTRWKRLLVSGEVIYVSPSGTTLRNLLQIKKYLLTAGTCKCGLPCPFKPEALFDFNPKVSLPFFNTYLSMRTI